MASFSRNDQRKLVEADANNPDSTAIDLLGHTRSRKDKAGSLMAGALSVGFIALLMFIGNLVGQNDRALAIVTGFVALGSMSVAISAYRYKKNLVD